MRARDRRQDGPLPGRTGAPLGEGTRTNPLLELGRHGQSYWLDDLSRKMIATGELRRRVEQEGLKGVTSNPDIFHEAISEGGDYDDQIRELVAADLPVHEIYERLAVTDVQEACDLLRPVYEASAGVDGFVSLEVSPYLAHDTAGTIAEVRRLWAAVGRPNLYVKIPGTLAGVPAIEEMLYQGIHINITLLFAVERYEAVAEAYLRALERRREAGRPLDAVVSVASFFLSRIDVLVDRLLGHRIVPAVTEGPSPRPEELLGRAAIANARLAYQSFRRLFGSERWRSLEKDGARVQRVLWASTSTKDPLYRDVRYVESLIGPDTVNTMPEQTIAAFADHGLVRPRTVEEGVEEAGQVMADLARAGIDFERVTDQLLDEGIQKFLTPFSALMGSLAERRLDLLGARAGGHRYRPGGGDAGRRRAAEALDARRFGRRLHAGDPFLWTADPRAAGEIRERLGWLAAPERFEERVGEIEEFAREIRDEGVRHVVHLGMGGSSLCPEVCREIFGTAAGWPELLVLDNTDPEAVREVAAEIDLARTLFIVASKSGTTVETLSFYRFFWERVRADGEGDPGRRFLAITDPGTPLAREAAEKRFRRCFENPADIGGRYSALSYFGLVPMALLGIDIGAVLARARLMLQSCGPAVPAGASPGAALGAILGIEARAGRDKVTFAFDPEFAPLGAWLEQLLAESTGKEGTGVVPVDGEALGSPEVYGADRLFVVLEREGAASRKEITALEAAGHPIVVMTMPDREALGAEFVRWEVATAATGAVLGVNPFDEPNVAESKRNTRELLEVWRREGSFGEGEEGAGAGKGAEESTEAAALPRLLAEVGAGDYVAILPYLHRTAARHEALQVLRHRIRDRSGAATTLGYGPRYLHSTGQLHKGGPDSGVFLILTAEAPGDLPIPGEDYGFATLQRAQALGDHRSLLDHGRRAVRIHLGPDVEAGLVRLAELL